MIFNGLTRGYVSTLSRVVIFLNGRVSLTFCLRVFAAWESKILLQRNTQCLFPVLFDLHGASTSNCER